MASTPPQDPRRTVTPDAFHVAPELLGLPLAGPGRRLAAMLVDLLVLALLVNAGSFLLALAAAVVLFRATGAASGSILRRGARVLMRVGAALLLFVGVLVLWGQVGRLLDGVGQDPPAVTRAEGEAEGGQSGTGLSGRQALGFLSDWRALARAGSQEEARPVARRMVQRARAAGADDEALRELAASGADLQGIKLPPWSAAAVSEAVREALGEPTPPEPTPPGPTPPGPPAEASTEALLRDYLAAHEAGDSATLRRVGGLLAPRIGADTLARLHGRLGTARAEAAAAERRLEHTREELRRRSGVRSLLTFLADDLGLGFGWAGLYFTAFLALWKGRTPGKRLLRMRVIRLDGRPLGWWASFERFGGYGASIVTGLMGFAEILWDRNRQGMHDKIARTVVVRT
ncbi:MAG TPA: RDD family protein [Longimicrobiales bacterium]|nr:RDD family protein [Longimicrobiales bacterium]